MIKSATFTKHFGKYGEITDSVIMKDRYSGHPRGFGFITYADPSVVDKVIEDTHVITGKQVSCHVVVVSLLALNLRYMIIFFKKAYNIFDGMCDYFGISLFPFICLLKWEKVDL